jgi:hypothetical protein
MKEKVVPIRVDNELYEWLKEYAHRKHSSMTAVITRLLVDHKEDDELVQSSREIRGGTRTQLSRKK